MRFLMLASLLALASSPTNAAGKLTGGFTCDYSGSLGCAPPGQPGGICVDSGRPQPMRFILQVNFDSKPFPRIRLNGLNGHLNYNRDGEAVAYWHLSGLGHPKFSTSVGEDGTVRATFISAYPNGGYDSSNFTCVRAPRPVL